MKLSNLVFVLATVIFGTSTAHAHNYVYDHEHHYHIQELESAVVAHDYLYDYSNSRWVRVNSYVDYVPCWDASSLVYKLRGTGFRVSYSGDWECPEQIEYSVFHDSFYVIGFDYHNHWATHHHSFHHYGVKVYFHYNVRHNKYHHYYGHSLYYGAKSRWSSRVKAKYRKWKRNHRYSVPVYHKNKNKVTYKKHYRKKSFNRSKSASHRVQKRSVGKKNKWKAGTKGRSKGGAYRNGGRHKSKSLEARSPRRHNQRGHVKTKQRSGKSGKYTKRGSNKGGKYAKRGHNRGKVKSKRGSCKSGKYKKRGHNRGQVKSKRGSGKRGKYAKRGNSRGKSKFMRGSGKRGKYASRGKQQTRKSNNSRRHRR